MRSDPEGERLAVQRIGHRLLIVESLEKHLPEAFDLAQPGSALADDDSRLGYLQLSHLVGHCLSVSTDALRTTRFVLRDSDNPAVIRLPMIGAFPMLRAATESAALAVWLLMPDESEERVRRALRARWDDIVHDDALMIAATEFDEEDTSREQRGAKQKMRRENSAHVRRKKNYLRELGRAAGIPESDFNGGLPGFGPIVAESAKAIEIRASHARSAWHAVSGLTHPSASRSTTLSDLEILSTDAAGVHRARISANPALVNTALESGVLFRLAALRLAAERGGNPAIAWTSPPELPLPPGWSFADGRLVHDG